MPMPAYFSENRNKRVGLQVRAQCPIREAKMAFTYPTFDVINKKTKSKPIQF